MVDVAQLVEPRIVIPVVAGSIPVVHPINLPLIHLNASFYVPQLILITLHVRLCAEGWGEFVAQSKRDATRDNAIVILTIAH